MSKVKSRLTKIITSILGFFGIMSFTSCYGAVMMYGVLPNYNVVTGCVQGDTDDDGEIEPVQGIRVVLKSSSSVSSDSESDITLREDKTDEDGRYYVYQTPSRKGDYIIEFIDVDGAENGDFETHSEKITFKTEGDYHEDEVDVTLKPKTKSE